MRNPPAPNDANRRLQLMPSDPRWEMRPPYGWVETQPGQVLSNGISGTKCWYCALAVDLSTIFLYSKRLSMLAHVECAAQCDTKSQERATRESTKKRD